MAEIANKTKDGQEIVVYDYTGYEGYGYDNQTSEDRMVPFLGLTQDLSPQLKKNKPEYIPGLELGNLFNSVTAENYGSDLLIIPAITEHVYTLWVPRDQGGGFRGRLPINDPIVRETKSRAAQQGNPLSGLMTKEGLELAETFYVWSVAQLGAMPTARLEPLIIAFTATKIPVYKRWQTRLSHFQLHNPTTGRKITPPLFAHLTRVSSREEQNSKGQPYQNLVFNSAIEDDIQKSLLTTNDPRFEIAKSLREMVVGGEAKAAYDSQQASVAPTDEIPF